MWKFISIIALSLGLTACIGAGSNSPVEQAAQGYFPHITGIDLQGQEQPLPASFAGKLNLVSIGFEREHQEPINTWIAYAETIEDQNADFRYYEVPLIYELGAAKRWWVNNGMRAGIPSIRARERTITVYTDREAFLEMMDMQKDRIYTLLLDESGKILWRSEGAITEAHKAALNKFIN